MKELVTELFVNRLFVILLVLPLLGLPSGCAGLGTGAALSIATKVAALSSAGLNKAGIFNNVTAPAETNIARRRKQLMLPPMLPTKHRY